MDTDFSALASRYASPDSSGLILWSDAAFLGLLCALLLLPPLSFLLVSSCVSLVYPVPEFGWAVVVGPVVGTGGVVGCTRGKVGSRLTAQRLARWVSARWLLISFSILFSRPSAGACWVDQ